VRAIPLVGVSAGQEAASWRAWRGQEAVVLSTAYQRSLAGAGAASVVLAPGGGHPAQVVEALDALVLSGGGDVDPARYGQRPHPRTGPWDGARDDYEFALLDAALARELAVLVICRGLQVLNVARGGTLHQHLPDVVGSAVHGPTPGEFGEHPVTVTPGSRLHDVLGRDELTVATHHHQAVDRLGRGLVAVAHAADGTVEAVEDPGLPSLLGVQWHPEVRPDAGLFTELVAAASRSALAGRRYTVI
jgi:putative glutamine amidotransferase